MWKVPRLKKTDLIYIPLTQYEYSDEVTYFKLFLVFVEIEFWLNHPFGKCLKLKLKKRYVIDIYTTEIKFQDLSFQLLLPSVLITDSESP